MNQKLTPQEIKKIQNLCFENPHRACAVVQTFIDTLQIMSCSSFAKLQSPKKSKRTILYQSKNLNGITIENRKFIPLNQ